MTVRITTPGLIAAAIAAIVLGVILAFAIGGHQNPQIVAVSPPAKAGTQTALGAFNPALIYQTRVAGVLTIQSTLSAESSIQGTGFVVDSRGYIITNYHVIA